MVQLGAENGQVGGDWVLMRARGELRLRGWRGAMVRLD